MNALTRCTRRTLVILVCTLTWLSTPAPVCLFAADEPAVPMVATEQVNGSVAKVSAVFGTVMVICELGYITFTVPDECTILRGPDEIDLDGIKLEESIMVQYRHPDKDTYIAVFIRVNPERKAF